VAAFTGSHRYILDYPACDWDALIATLLTLHDQQREANLDTRRGHRPRMTAPGTGRRPVLTLADRLLATILHQRLALPQVAIATLFGVRPETINKRIRDIRQLLDQAGYTIQPRPAPARQPGRPLQSRDRRGNNRASRDQDSVLIICKLLERLHWCRGMAGVRRGELPSARDSC
jgi:hypothetical protein